MQHIYDIWNMICSIISDWNLAVFQQEQENIFWMLGSSYNRLNAGTLNMFFNIPFVSNQVQILQYDSNYKL